MVTHSVSRFILLFSVVFLFAKTVCALPNFTTYHAKIIKPDGYPLQSVNVRFRFTIMDPAGVCILYSEDYNNVNMLNSSGVVSFSLGSGIKNFPTSGAVTFADVFNNGSASLDCAAGGPASYSPAADDARNIVMQFNDSSGWQTLPAMSINAVPYAMYAQDAQTLNGLDSSNFVHVSSLPSCTASQVIQYNGVSFNCLSISSSGGGLTSSDINSALGYTPANTLSVGSSFSVLVSDISNLGSSVTTLSSSLGDLAFENQIDLSGPFATGILPDARIANQGGIASGAQYTKLTVDGKGRVVSGSSITTGDVISALGYVPSASGSLVSSQWEKSASALYYNLGNVGIGTSSPTVAFELNAPVSSVFASQFKVVDGNTSGYLSISDGITSVNKYLPTIELRSAGVNGFGGAIVGRIPHTLDLTVSDGAAVIVDGRTTSETALTNSNLFTVRNNGEPVVVVQASGTVGIGTISPAAKLDVSGAVRIGMDSVACTSNNSGSIRYNLGNVEFCNGSLWSAFGIAGVGVVNLNGSTSGTQSFQAGAAGTQPSFVTQNGIHTLNIPLAAVGSVSAGLISNSDYVSFSGKITSSTASISQVLGYTPASATALENFLVKSNNLSDLTSVVSARANLGLGGFATISSLDLGSASATGILNEARLPSFSNITSGAQYTKVTVDGKGRVTSGSQINLSDVTTALGYTPASASASTQWSSSGSAISYVAGNVGIGTSNPVSALNLEVAGSGEAFTLTDASASGSYFRIKDGTASANQFLPAIQTKSVGYQRFSGWYSEIVSADDFGSAGVFQLNARTNDADIVSAVAVRPIFQIKNHATTLLTLTASGNLGMGTVSPEAPLEISSTGGEKLLLRDNDSLISDNTYSSYIRARDASGSVAWYIGDGSASSNNLSVMNYQSASILFATSSTTRLLINASGNVGVGPITPTANLHIQAGTSSLGPLKFTSGTLLTSPQSGTMEYDGSQFYLTDGSNSRRSIATGSSAGSIDNTSIINSSGNLSLVPVGSVIVSSTVASTNSTTGALVVRGGVGISGQVNLASGLNVSGSSIIDGTLRLAGMTSGSLLFAGISGTVSQDNSNLFWDGANKRLGIGTSITSSFKLSLSGTASSADRKMGINGTQMIYLPDQTNFAGSLFVGDGAGSISHSSGSQGFHNTGIGLGALNSVTTGADNTAAGFNALRLTTTGTNNDAFGSYALSSNLNGSYNLANGSGALSSNTTGDSNVAVGFDSLSNNTTGAGNVANGYNALLGSRTKSESTAIGYYSMYYSDTTSAAPSISYNTAIGAYSLRGSGTPSNNTGTMNTALGHSALMGVASGSGNIAIGYNAGSAITSGNYNVVVGSTSASAIATSSNNILIADGQGNERVRINSSGSVGIGTSNPQSLLDLQSTTNGSKLDIIQSSVSAGDNAGLRFAVTTASNARKAGIFFERVSGADARGTLHFANNDVSAAGTLVGVSDSRMSILSSGQVGIGTSSPTVLLTVDDSAGTVSAPYIATTDKLAIIGTNNAVIQVTTPNTAAGGIYFSDPQNRDPGGLTYSHLNDSMTFRVNLGTRMTIVSSGAVGIGTSTPNAILQLAGNRAPPSWTTTGVNLAINNNTITDVTGSGTITLRAVNTVGIPTLAASTGATTLTHATNFYIAGPPAAGANTTISNSSALYVASGNSYFAGSVGIATSSPSYTLDVSGTLRVSGQAYTNTGNGNFSILSDVRYKDVHGEFNRGLAEILNIKIIKFNYKKGNPLGSDPNREYIGVSAQNLKGQIPEAVETRSNENGNFLTINTSPVIWTALNAIKELYFKMTSADEVLNRKISSISESKADKSEIEQLRLEIKYQNERSDRIESENRKLKQYLCKKDPSVSICD